MYVGIEQLDEEHVPPCGTLRQIDLALIVLVALHRERRRIDIQRCCQPLRKRRRCGKIDDLLMVRHCSDFDYVVIGQFTRAQHNNLQLDAAAIQVIR